MNNENEKNMENSSIHEEIKERIEENETDLEKANPQDFKEFLADTEDVEEEVEVQEPFFYKIIMIVAALVFLIAVGVMSFGYVNIQNERKASLERLSMQKGEAVKLPKKEESPKKEVKTKKLSVAEAQKQMRKPMERLGEHVTKTDEMSEKFLKDPDVAYTTEWKMDYQSHMKEIRESNAELQAIIANTDDDVYKQYGQIFNKIVEFTAVRYEAIVEKDQEKLIHALNLAQEFEKDLPESAKWFE